MGTPRLTAVAVALTALRTAALLGCSCLVASPALGQTAPAPARSGPLFRAEPDAAPPALPSPPSHDARLVYTRGPGAEACPDEAGFRSAVAANVGRDPFIPSAPRIAAVTIQREGSVFVGRLELRNAAGAQEWTHEPLSRTDCRDLVRIMGLSIAIPIDPFPAHPLGAVALPAAPLPPTAFPSSSPAPPGDHLPPAAAPPAAERPKIRVGLRAGVALGTEPAVTGGFAVQVGVRWPLASLSAELRADVPTSGAGNVAPMSRVEAGLVAGSLVPCVHVPLPARFNIPICGLLTLGGLHGEGLSVKVQRSGSQLYAAVGGRVGLEIPVNDAGSIALRVDGDLLGVVPPVAITLNGMEAWTTGRVNGGAGGGVRFDF